jgi:hypothetical protein
MQSSDPRRLPMRSRSDNSRYETPGATSAIHPSSQRVLQIVEGHAGRRGLLTLVGSCCWALSDRLGTTGSGLFAVRNRPVADIWAASNASNHPTEKRVAVFGSGAFVSLGITALCDQCLQFLVVGRSRYAEKTQPLYGGPLLDLLHTPNLAPHGPKTAVLDGRTLGALDSANVASFLRMPLQSRITSRR